MIKIIHFISSLSRGGRERQLATIVSNTNKTFNTRIIYLNHKENNYVQEYGLQDALIRIKANGRMNRLKELYYLIRQEKPDIVYTWGNGETLSMLLLKPFLSFRLINGSVRHGVRSRRFSHYFRTFVLQFSKNIVANSHAGLRANNLKRGFVLYNGIENKFFIEQQIKSKKKKSLGNIPGNISLIASVANLVPYKDYFTVIDALKKVKDNQFDFKYIILGDGPLRREIQKYIIDNDLKEQIKILGNVPNVSEHLSAADIFIHSSKGEGTSNAILEAMAVGLPIIATSTGGTSEIIDSSFGRLFHYKNSKELFEKLVELLGNKELAKQMGEKANIVAKERFTISKMIEGYNMIINKVMNN